MMSASDSWTKKNMMLVTHLIWLVVDLPLVGNMYTVNNVNINGYYLVNDG